VFSVVNSAVNMTLPVFDAVRRAAAPLLLRAGPAIDRYPARRALSSKPVARRSCCRTMGQTTNGRTDRQTARPTRDRSIDPAPHVDCQ